MLVKNSYTAPLQFKQVLSRQKVGRTATLDHKVTLWKWLAPLIWKPATFPLHVVPFKTLGNKAKTKPLVTIDAFTIEV